MRNHGPYVLVECLGGRFHGCQATAGEHATRFELPVTHAGQFVGYDTYQVWGQLALFVFHRPASSAAYWES